MCLLVHSLLSKIYALEIMLNISIILFFFGEVYSIQISTVIQTGMTFAQIKELKILIFYLYFLQMIDALSLEYCSLKLSSTFVRRIRTLHFYG